MSMFTFERYDNTDEASKVGQCSQNFEQQVHCTENRCATCLHTMQRKCSIPISWYLNGNFNCQMYKISCASCVYSCTNTKDYSPCSRYRQGGWAGTAGREYCTYCTHGNQHRW